MDTTRQDVRPSSFFNYFMIYPFSDTSLNRKTICISLCCLQIAHNPLNINLFQFCCTMMSMSKASSWQRLVYRFGLWQLLVASATCNVPFAIRKRSHRYFWYWQFKLVIFCLHTAGIHSIFISRNCQLPQNKWKNIH